MSGLGIRPRFSRHLEFDVAEAQATILREIERGDEDCEIKVFPRFICLRIPLEDRHFWSPRLNLALETSEEGGTRVDGVFGPNANLWSLFTFGWLIIGSIGLFAGSLGWAQLSLGTRPWGMWIFLAMLAAAVALYVLARVGRKIAAPQVDRLHRIFESSLGRAGKSR